MNKSDFHVGQTIYIGSVLGSAMSGHLNLATITSIGKKWIRFKYLYDEFSKGRFIIKSGLVDNGGDTPDKIAVLNPIEYYDIVDARRLRCAIILRSKAFESCTATQLKEIARIANIPVKFCERKYKAKENT